MLQGRRELRQGTNSTEISQKTISKKKRKANKRVPEFSCMKDDFMRKLRKNLAHTFTYFVNLGF
jgi:hypothetical protein